MLKIAKNPEWTHQIDISVPVDGGFETHTCRARYRVLDPAAIDPTDAANPETLLRAVVVRVEDLADEAGQPLDWNDAVRDAVFAMPFVQSGLIKGYYRSVAGAREGNSDGLGVLGRRVN
ncbi:MAG: hypothetical protein Q7J44_14210 [Pseudotabrizicola sp.]|uniref:hypothetical protein n=1 Tax=Pseudotabrizicola sp. TaxID=2939647 RepID=UPI0027267797|nr:hypothetical protein [Pseudotabrizicola sp.]MDO9639690.1 hypothetical protein [Pseudotabrizicola sp.]